MLTLSPAVRVFLAWGVTDMRRSVDGLSALVTSSMELDPFSGHLFLFRNRRGDRLKILVWDRTGFWVMYKRLEKGTFAWPESGKSGSVELTIPQLLMLLEGIEGKTVRMRPRYTREAA
jgi:transposase